MRSFCLTRLIQRHVMQRFENTVLIHLIELYSRHRCDNLDKGLDFVQIGVEHGLVYELTRTPKHQDHLLKDAFEVTCMPKISPNAITEKWVII